MKTENFFQGLKTGTLFWVSSDVTNRTADIWFPYNKDYMFSNRVEEVVNWISKLKLDLSFMYFDEPVNSFFLYFFLLKLGLDTLISF